LAVTKGTISGTSSVQETVVRWFSTVITLVLVERNENALFLRAYWTSHLFGLRTQILFLIQLFSTE
jgi:hypothetical protein